jgi:phosphatidyl-myo-inositol dimannoside synthase
MRILMLNNEFPPLGGGTGTVNQALLRQFAVEDNLTIDLVTAALGKHAEQTQWADRIRIFNVPVNNRNIHHSSNRELVTYAVRALRLARSLQRTHTYDLCFAWSAVPAGAVAWALRRLTGLPYLVRVCGPDIPGFERRYGALYPVLTPVIRSVWRHASAVVAKCDGEADMIRAVDPQVDVSLVANGVDLSAFQPHPSPSSDGPLRLLCVARLIERKGQVHAIEAVKRLHDAGVDVVLDLVGTGDAEAAYVAQAQALGVADRVRFVGYVPRSSISDYYAAADVFVLPSYNEGMSVATLEALAAGLPVVVTRTGGTDELVREGVNGFVFDWADVNTLTAHLARLAADRQPLRRMSVAAREHARAFSWERAASTYLDLFASLTGKQIREPNGPSLLPLQPRVG